MLEKTLLIHQCCIASFFCTLHCFVMPISLLTELQIPVLVSNQSFFISGQAVCRKREPLQQSCLHSLRKGGAVEHPSPASTPGCALKCRSSKSLEIKGVLGFWRQFSNPALQSKAYFNIMLLFRLALPTAQSSALKTAKLFLLAPPKNQCICFSFKVFASVSPLVTRKEGQK